MAVSFSGKESVIKDGSSGLEEGRGDSSSEGRLVGELEGERAGGESEGLVGEEKSRERSSEVDGNEKSSGSGLSLSGDDIMDCGLGCGAMESLLLCRRSNSACKFLTGDEARSYFLFGLLGPFSNKAIAWETGTLLSVVWLRSSSKSERSASSRSPNSSKTRSIDERDPVRACVGILKYVRGLS